MKHWDPENLRERFLYTATNAEAYMLACKTKAVTRDTYKASHDEHLAQFYVFNYLHGQTFFATRAQFLSGLRSLLDTQPPAPREAFNGQRFLAHRQTFINSLIREMEDASV